MKKRVDRMFKIKTIQIRNYIGIGWNETFTSMEDHELIGEVMNAFFTSSFPTDYNDIAISKKEAIMLDIVCIVDGKEESYHGWYGGPSMKVSVSNSNMIKSLSEALSKQTGE